MGEYHTVIFTLLVWSNLSCRTTMCTLHVENTTEGGLKIVQMDLGSFHSVCIRARRRKEEKKSLFGEMRHSKQRSSRIPLMMMTCVCMYVCVYVLGVFW